MPLSPINRRRTALLAVTLLLTLTLLAGCAGIGARPPADPAAELRAKYYDYFAQHNSTINPLFTFSDPADIADGNLMIFAILNSYARRQADGTIAAADIDATLNRYFGRTVKRYETWASAYDATKKLVAPVGFSFNSSVHMMLVSREDGGDGTWRGTFDVFNQPDPTDSSKQPPDYRAAIVAGQTAGLPQPERYVIRFREVAASEGFYLQYLAIDDAIYTNPELNQPEIVNYADGQVEILGEKIGFNRKDAPAMGLNREGRLMFNAVRFFLAATGGDTATLQKLAAAPLAGQLNDGTAFALRLKELSASRDPVAIEPPTADDNGYQVKLTYAEKDGQTRQITVGFELAGAKVQIRVFEPK